MLTTKRLENQKLNFVEIKKKKNVSSGHSLSYQKSCDLKKLGHKPILAFFLRFQV
jgi:hypothetical protein